MTVQTFLQNPQVQTQRLDFEQGKYWVLYQVALKSVTFFLFPPDFHVPFSRCQPSPTFERNSIFGGALTAPFSQNLIQKYI